MANPLTCPDCDGWGRIPRLDQLGTAPCPNPIHKTTRTSPTTGPTAGAALEADRRKRRSRGEP